MGLHFLFINLIAQGILLFNFGFAIANKKGVMTSSKKKTNTTNVRVRRETILDLAFGGGATGSDDEDDDEEYYSKSLFVTTGGNDMYDSGSSKDKQSAKNPFKMGS
jgi:hypothetical protein